MTSGAGTVWRLAATMSPARRLHVGTASAERDSPGPRTGHGGSAGTDDARVYIFDEFLVVPVAEPTGLSLLGLALLGLKKRRS